jgi:glycosyltransferase involved in cell wall biosynthesis
MEYGAFFLYSFFWITRRVLGRHVDLVYINSPPDFFVFAGLIAKLRRIPIVLDVHDPMPELFFAKGRSSGLIWQLLSLQERWSVRFATRVITVHEPLRSLLQSRSPDIEMDIVMNVPDTSGWPVEASAPAGRLIVFAGTVAFRYGLDDLVTAMSIVKEDIPDLRLRIIGEGEDLDNLLELAQALGVEDRVETVGRVPWTEIRERQEGAWLGANVPKPDALGELSFSNKVVEWVAMGLPVLASRTGTMVRYFPDDALVYVEPGSVESIATTLLQLAADGPLERAQRVQKAQAALSLIAWPVQRAELLRIVNSVRG